jgi:Spy/CpxP family protein refolding chaperone
LSSTRLLSAVTLVAALVIPSAAFAQTAPGPYPSAAPANGARQHHHRRHDGMRAALRGLNLSSAQQTQIRQAFQESRTANRSADPATRKANRAKLRARIEAILTPAQRTQLQATLKARAQHRS